MKIIEESQKALFYIKKYLQLGRYFLEERFINFFSLLAYVRDA